MASRNEIDREKEARSLCELFRGRFTDTEARRLIRVKGGVAQAVEFVLEGDPQDVRGVLNGAPEILEELQRDSQHVRLILVEGIQTSIRLFACQSCERFWWRRTPARKEVSRCKNCRVRYDPVPRDKEWGLAEYVCDCGNTFRGMGQMGVTSPCYRCGASVYPASISKPESGPPPPRRRRHRHSCSAGNCYNRAAGGDGSHQQCPHELSSRERSVKVLHPSNRHISTGSTVRTFLSQGSLDADFELDLASVQELDEDEIDENS